jgi:ADP-ribose pyrophosphatase
MNLTEKQLSSTTVYDGKILKLNVDEVLLPDGKKSKRECVRHSGGAAVLFVNGDEIALVEQFRYAYGKTIYEIPAGKLNSGEDPEYSAKRELEEETGYRAEKLEFLADIYPTPGYTDEIIYIYYTDNAKYVAQHLDEGEFLRCKFFKIKDVLSMLESGQIKDAKTQIAIYKYLLNKSNRG